MTNIPPPPPPGYTPYAAGPAAGPHPRGTIVLVLGILSFFCFGIVLGIVAFLMGNAALKEIDANPGRYTNRGTVNAGRICGIIGFVLSLLVVVIVASQ